MNADTVGWLMAAVVRKLVLFVIAFLMVSSIVIIC
jgi:hypothetical protein